MFWLFARNVLMLPGSLCAHPASVPSRPPGDSEAAIESCASFSQLLAVADAALTEAMAMGVDRDRFASIYAASVNDP